MNARLLIALGLAPTLSAAVGAALALGDVNGDGLIAPVDAALVAGHLAGSTALDASQFARADCNGEPGLDCADIVWILNDTNVPLPEMVTVPAGKLRMGDPWGEGDSLERPVHPVFLSAYEIGRYEVTNAEYAAFLNTALGAGEITVTSNVVYLSGNSADALFYPQAVFSYSQITHSGGTFTPRTRSSRTLGLVSMADHPVVAVTWHGAAAYCNWLSRQQGYQEVYAQSGLWPSNLSRNGYHLPTEAQWERAAGWDPAHNDPVVQGHWRYGFQCDSIDFSRANYVNGSTSANPLSLTSYPYTSPAGFYNGVNVSRTGAIVNSPSAAGCYDMSGNVWEWCNDWWYRVYAVDSVSDPAGPSTGTYRVLRGGSSGSNGHDCRSAERDPANPSGRNHGIGFRVSRNP